MIINSTGVDVAAKDVVGYVLHPQLKFWCRWHRLRGAQPSATDVLLPSPVHMLSNRSAPIPDIFYFQNTPEVTSVKHNPCLQFDCIIDYFCTEPWSRLCCIRFSKFVIITLHYITLQERTKLIKKKRQEARLSQRDRATLHVIEYFAKSLKITQGHSKWHCWVGRSVSPY